MATKRKTKTAEVLDWKAVEAHVESLYQTAQAKRDAKRRAGQIKTDRQINRISEPVISHEGKEYRLRDYLKVRYGIDVAKQDRNETSIRFSSGKKAAVMLVGRMGEWVVETTGLLVEDRRADTGPTDSAELTF